MKKNYRPHLYGEAREATLGRKRSFVANENSPQQAAIRSSRQLDAGEKIDRVKKKIKLKDFIKGINNDKNLTKTSQCSYQRSVSTTKLRKMQKFS